MKLTRYTKFTGDLSTGFDLEDLMQALGDFLLDSGFQDPFSPFQNMDDWGGRRVHRPTSA